MQWRNTASRYGFVAVFLHWIIVVGIIAQYFLAEAAEDREGTVASALGPANLHNSLGIVILGLALLRGLWRFVELPPARPVSMKQYEITLARAAHLAFYALLFVIPLSGWALATTNEQPLSFFGLFDLPPLRIGGRLPISGGMLSEDRLEELHELLFNILFGLALLHIAASLKHQFLDRDSVLRSMLPWWRKNA